MQHAFSDGFTSVAGEGEPALIPQTLRRATAAIAFLVLAGGMAYWAYSLGTRDASSVPVIRAMEGPARVQPEDPGGLQAEHQGLEVNSVLGNTPAPTPRDTQVLEEAPALAAEDGPQGELISTAPSFLAAQVQAEIDAAEAARVAEPEFAEASGEATAAATGDAASGASDAAGQEGEAADAAPAQAEAGVTVSGPAVRPRSRPGTLASVGTSQAEAAPSQAEEAPSQAVSQAREVASLSPGARLVQLGAFDSPEITRQAWNTLVAQHGDLLGSKSLYVERTTANARVFYRLRVSGFSSSEETRVMCESLRARGVDCIPVTLQ